MSEAAIVHGAEIVVATEAVADVLAVVAVVVGAVDVLAAVEAAEADTKLLRQG